MKSSLPIAVDLDGTLLRTDTLFESVARLLQQNVFFCLLLPIWLIKGKAYMKEQIANRVTLDAALLPYNEEVLDYLREQRDQGRSLVLATASHRRYASAVSDHLKIFDEVLATESENLKAERKAEALTSRFGAAGFVYAGNDTADIAVWKRSAASIVVSHDRNLVEQAKALAPLEWHSQTARPGLHTFLEACRIHQWLKNLLLFVPLFTSQQFMDTGLLLQTVTAFIAFGLCASSVYLLNDLLDLDSDRQHRTKCRRPFASGDMPLSYGLFLIPLLLAAAACLLPFLPIAFAVVLLIYYVATTLYSFWLKRIAIIDVLVLAGLYTCRIVAGGVATGILISQWLLMFSLFVFLSLAMLKRYTELVSLSERGLVGAVKGRGYWTNDKDILGPLGAGSGLVSVLIFALYLNSGEIAGLYSNSYILWGISPLLLFWISRAWIMAHRGEMNDDPIVFAARDNASRIVGLLVALMFILASL